MQINTFFNVEAHFNRIQRKIVACITTPSVYLSLCARMPDILDILTHDIESMVPKLYKDINYQRSLKKFKLSTKSFRKLMDEGFSVLLSNYKHAVAGVGGGSLLRDNRTSKQEFAVFESQARELYNQILTQLFLQSKNDKRTLRNDRLILTCAVIAAITGSISLFRF